MSHFKGIVKHQLNFLNWVQTRHEYIKALNAQLRTANLKKTGKGPRGSKDATFTKYRWYAEHLVLLESINAFETFYKRTFTELGGILQPYVNPSAERIIRINAQMLWNITGGTVLPSMIPAIAFEHELFHDLDQVDSTTDMMIGKRRYNRKISPNPLKDRIRAIRGAFQVRHTLSHNAGLVIKGDKSNFKTIGFDATESEVIDPSKNRLLKAILKELETEASEFTEWLRMGTAEFLVQCIKERGASVPLSKRAELEALLGSDTCWNKVTWTP